MLRSLALILVFCLTSASYALDQGKTERIMLLEKQIDALTAQIITLRAQNETLVTQLAGIRSILDAAATQSETAEAVVSDSETIYCLDRLADLRGRRDNLAVLGYTPNHPDMTNLAAQIHTVSEECDALMAAQSR